MFPLTETVRPQLGLQREVTLTSSSLFVLFGQQTYPLMPINPAFCTHALLKRKLDHGWHRPCSVYTLGLQNRSFQSCTLRKKKRFEQQSRYFSSTYSQTDMILQMKPTTRPECWCCDISKGCIFVTNVPLYRVSTYRWNPSVFSQHELPTL